MVRLSGSSAGLVDVKYYVRKVAHNKFKRQIRKRNMITINQANDPMHP